MTRTDPCLRRWIARSLLALLLLAGLAGCGASLVYPRLDSLVGLYVRGLVSLDGSQSASLARTLKHNLEWHRSEELERYDAFLQELAAQNWQRKSAAESRGQASRTPRNGPRSTGGASSSRRRPATPLSR